jgi:GR25 family glycosyltransferase involved in LPS biosynthesis
LTIAERIKQSHIEVVKLAKKNNLPYICIFEDDAYPQKDIVK